MTQAQQIQEARRADISFVVPGIPTPWARAGGRGGIRFTPAKQRSFAAAVKTICAAAMLGAPPLTGPVEMRVMAIYPWPKSWSPRKRAAPGASWKTSRPDIDNCCHKLVADALNGIAWTDDALIVSAHAWKCYGDLPGLRVKITTLVGE